MTDASIDPREYSSRCSKCATRVRGIQAVWLGEFDEEYAQQQLLETIGAGSRAGITFECCRLRWTVPLHLCGRVPA